MSKFTPAPWKIDHDLITGPDGFDICTVSVRRLSDVHGVVEDEGEGNARLIAAAPLMYEALRKFTADYMDAPGDARLEDNPLGDAYDEALAAIAAARGTDDK